jgi:Uma2 family endonuclease
MATVARTLVTLAEYRAMESDVPTELVRGEVIEVPPPADFHGVYCANIVGLLWEWSPRQSKGTILSNDTGLVVEQNPDTVRGPDVMLLSKYRLPPGGFTGDWVRVPPDLIVEVRSPSNAWGDVLDKVGQYLRAGVREVWVLNPPRRTIHIYRPEPDAEPAVLDGSAELTTDVLPGFRCTVGDFFAGI